MENLMEWESAQGAATTFPLLKHLEIKNCPQLRIAPSHFPSLENIQCCNAGIFANALFSEEFFLRNQNLSSLVVDGCKNLKFFQKDLHKLHSLHILRILNCPELKSIPYGSRQSQGLKSLEELEIRNCRELTRFPIGILDSCTSSLNTLVIGDLYNLASPLILSPFLQRMESLTTLQIYRIPKVLKMPTEISSLRNLTHLGIGGFSDSLDVVTFNEGLDAILPQFHSLELLDLYGREHLEYLPYQLRHLTCLWCLSLLDYGIEELPEWIRNLSSLYSLTIVNCKKLRHLPSKQAIQRLTKLTGLRIGECPLLKCTKEERSDADSEWPKISHIKYVTVE